MADPVTPEAEEPQVPVEPGPGEPGTPGVDYQKRYDDLRPQYDKTYQELQAERQWKEAVRNDPEARAQFLQELGYVIEEEPGEVLSDDPVEALRQEFSTLKEQWQAEQQAAAEQQQLAQAMQAGEAHIAQEFNQISRTDLTDEDQAWIISRALSLPADQAGLPDIKTAFKEFEAFEERRMKQWAASKRTTHRVSPSGGAGEAVPDTAKHDGRVELMLSRLQDAAD